MKWNGFSILGLGLVAVGVLFLIAAVVFALSANPAAANSSGPTRIGNFVYVGIGLGMMITGALITFLGQGRRPAKDPAAPL